jgi:hypothetical protein
MYGDTMGNLSVYIQDVDKMVLQSSGEKLREIIGNQGRSWHYSNVTISSNTRFKVITANIIPERYSKRTSTRNLTIGNGIVVPQLCFGFFDYILVKLKRNYIHAKSM